MDLISARCRPNTFSIASEISSTVVGVAWRVICHYCDPTVPCAHYNSVAILNALPSQLDLSTIRRTRR